MTRFARRNHGRLEVVTYVRADAYSVPRDSICQRGCVVLFRGPDSISMYARPGKTQLGQRGHPPRHARAIIELSSPRVCRRPFSRSVVRLALSSLHLFLLLSVLCLSLIDSSCTDTEIIRDTSPYGSAHHFLFGLTQSMQRMCLEYLSTLYNPTGLKGLKVA